MTNGVEAPKGLKLRGKWWHISRHFNGKPVRASTGCTDLENAIQVYRSYERAHMTENLNDWWLEQIKIAAEAKTRESWLMKALYRAQSRRNVRCDLTRDDMVVLARRCDGRCSVTGIPFSNVTMGRRKPFVPSLDRIDCDQPYTVGNCRFVCMIVNYALSDFGERAFSVMARAYVSRKLTLDIAESLHKPGTAT